MNNKGFAISGILYSILALFLILLLLILGNFQSRKVIFDKQKDNVLEKLEGVTINFVSYDFLYNDELTNELQRFETPSDGLYQIEIYYSNGGNYIKGEVRLYQGIPLYILVGKDSKTSIRTEANRVNTEILRCDSVDCYAYTSDKDPIEDITIDYVNNVVNETADILSDYLSEGGFVKITRIED